MEHIDTPLSNVDINKMIKKFEKRGVNIIEGSKIHENTDIEDIFKHRGHCVVFHRYPGQDVGHWITLIRDRHKNVAFFDSLGKTPKYYIKELEKCLKNNGIKNFMHNKKKYQGDNSVCGRYAVVICTLNKLKLPVAEMYKFLEEGKKKHKSYDKFILELTT